MYVYIHIYIYIYIHIWRERERELFIDLCSDMSHVYITCIKYQQLAGQRRDRRRRQREAGGLP